MHPIKAVLRTVTAGAFAAITITSVQATDELNVAFFLEWATPNMIAKSQKAYEEDMTAAGIIAFDVVSATE